MADPWEDEIVCESLRRIAWRQHAPQNTLPIPKEGWPSFDVERVNGQWRTSYVTPQQIWEGLMPTMSQAEYDQINAERFRVGHDRMMAEISLEERAAKLAQDEAALKAREVEAARLAAPATPEETAALDTERVCAWVAASLGLKSIGEFDSTTVDPAAFTRSLATIPPAGWPDAKSEQDHLRALRTTAAPVVEAEPEPIEGGGFLAGLKV